MTPPRGDHVCMSSTGPQNHKIQKLSKIRFKMSQMVPDTSQTCLRTYSLRMVTFFTTFGQKTAFFKNLVRMRSTEWPPPRGVMKTVLRSRTLYNLKVDEHEKVFSELWEDRLLCFYGPFLDQNQRRSSHSFIWLLRSISDEFLLKLRSKADPFYACFTVWT